MLLRTILSLVLVALLTGTGAIASLAHPATKTQTQSKDSPGDPISGEWEGRFEIGGGSATATFKLKLEGDKIAGIVESAHTGPGTLSQGLLADNKVSFTLNFAAHESIAVTGSFQDDKLGGEFRTEGMIGKWTAKKKATPAAKGLADSEGVGSAKRVTLSPEFIAGEWDLTLESLGKTAPVTLKLNVEGNKVTGTSESAHLGAGIISKGSWTPDKLNFNIEGAVGSISISGTLKEGKLVGEFDMSEMHGTFTAKKK